MRPLSMLFNGEKVPSRESEIPLQLRAKHVGFNLSVAIQSWNERAYIGSIHVGVGYDHLHFRPGLPFNADFCFPHV